MIHSVLNSLLRLQFSHLNEHEFRHGFEDTINPMCACGSEVETAEIFSCVENLFENLQKIGSSLLNLNMKDKVSFLLNSF